VLDTERAVDAYIAEARLLQKDDDQPAVLRVYETALAAHPDNDDLLYNRALFAADIGRVDWAERDLTEILKRQPDNADALNALGYTLADLTERYDEAYGYILKAYKLKPDNPAIVDSLGWVYYRLGKLDQALKYLSLALEKSQDPEIAAHLGEVLWISGDRVAARRVWDRALEIDPDDAKLRSVVERFE
jgi:tetratricopeptide (TPR) repeat protein